MHYLKGFEAFRFVGFGMGLGAILMISGAGFGNRAQGERLDTTEGKFKIDYPDLSALHFGPCVAEDPSPCASEAAALAAALATLEAARASAEALYDAYVACVDANGGWPNPVPVNPEPVNPKTTPRLAGTVSVLTR